MQNQILADSLSNGCCRRLFDGNIRPLSQFSKYQHFNALRQLADVCRQGILQQLPELARRTACVA